LPPHKGKGTGKTWAGIRTDPIPKKVTVEWSTTEEGTPTVVEVKVRSQLPKEFVNNKRREGIIVFTILENNIVKVSYNPPFVMPKWHTKKRKEKGSAKKGSANEC
jgi:hypothetical protein